jgi:RNA polymerase-binding transcription factor DksA
MKYVSCSNCGDVVPTKKTVVIENKRICHECKKQNSKAEQLKRRNGGGF